MCNKKIFALCAQKELNLKIRRGALKGSSEGALSSGLVKGLRGYVVKGLRGWLRALGGG